MSRTGHLKPQIAGRSRHLIKASPPSHPFKAAVGPWCLGQAGPPPPPQNTALRPRNPGRVPSYPVGPRCLGPSPVVGTQGSKPWSCSGSPGIQVLIPPHAPLEHHPEGQRPEVRLQVRLVPRTGGRRGRGGGRATEGGAGGPGGGVRGGAAPWLHPWFHPTASQQPQRVHALGAVLNLHTPVAAGPTPAPWPCPPWNHTHLSTTPTCPSGHR